MSRRLQVLMSEQEYLRVKRLARKNRKSVGAYVRELLHQASLETGEATAAEKLKSIEKSAHYEFPVANVETMLQEIEAGYVEELLDSDRFEPSDVPHRKRTSTKK